MTNPYKPSTVESSKLREWSPKQFHWFAGTWFAASGLIHLVAVNLLARKNALSAFDWTPLFLTVLGVLVTLEFRLAIGLARLMGSFTVVGLCATIVLLFVGFGNGSELTYGDVTVTDPQPWQILLVLVVIGVTMLPPWWVLQRAVGVETRVHRRMWAEQVDR